MSYTQREVYPVEWLWVVLVLLVAWSAVAGLLFLVHRLRPPLAFRLVAWAYLLTSAWFGSYGLHGHVGYVANAGARLLTPWEAAEMFAVHAVVWPFLLLWVLVELG